MPGLKYDYSASSFAAETHIAELNREIRDYCESHPLHEDDNRQKLISRLLRRAGTAAYRGATKREGGPFGAMLVDFHTPDGVPKVVGYGTNHVVPGNDPSAHAEMTAIRDAAGRMGRTDLSGLTLLTSCECCPMCLAAATGCRLDKIFFAATREDAAKAGFSDAAQYALMRSGGIEKHAERAHDPAAAERVLDGHAAVVVVRTPGGKRYFYGDDETASLNDPTALPVVQAIRKACRDQGGFHLPEDTVIISRHKPHPLSLIVSAWARIGAIRDKAYPDDPARDHPNKDASKIRYLADQWEAMTVQDANHVTKTVDPDKIWEEIKNPGAVHMDRDLGRARQIAFREWDRLVNNNFMPRY